MPNLLEPVTANPTRTQFVASPALDLLNAMYFTSLADQLEAVGDWPIRTRQRMDPALRQELDFLFSYPRQEPGVMGALNDVLFLHPEAWAGVDDLLRFVRDLPAKGDRGPEHPSIQGLAIYALRWPGHDRYARPRGLTPRAALAAELEKGVNIDLSCSGLASDLPPAGVILELVDRPEEIRSRILALIRRVYDEHYRADLDRRLACMQRSVAHHDRDLHTDPETLLRTLTARNASCLEDQLDRYTRFVFVPSVDVGPYNSCADPAAVHGLYYGCEAQFAEAAPEPHADTTQRLALVYRALGDEQRLRILHLLRDRELYATEIVELTGIHQSVVSRHLALMKAVGIVNVRRDENRKYYSINAGISDELRHAVDAFLQTVSPPREEPAAAAARTG